MEIGQLSFFFNAPIKFHPFIRNERVCLKATISVIEISRKYSSRIHILHISTKSEADLLNSPSTLRHRVSAMAKVEQCIAG